MHEAHGGVALDEGALAIVAYFVELLVVLGLLTEKRFNRIRIFRVNHSNPYTNAVGRFLAEWRSISSESSGQAVERAFS